MSVGFGTNLLTNPSLVSITAPGTGIGGTSVMPYNYNQNQGLVPQQGSPVLGVPGFVSPQVVAAQNVQPVIAPSSAQEAQLLQFGFDIAACRMVQRAYPSLTAQVLLALVQAGVPARTVLNNPGNFAFPTGGVLSQALGFASPYFSRRGFRSPRFAEVVSEVCAFVASGGQVSQAVSSLQALGSSAMLPSLSSGWQRVILSDAPEVLSHCCLHCESSGYFVQLKKDSYNVVLVDGVCKSVTFYVHEKCKKIFIVKED